MDDDGKTLKVTQVLRNSAEALNPDIKSGNYLNNILALDEARKDGFDDCLMLTSQHLLSELSRSNIW